jgi:ketosteroid isomerase-like protein
MADAGTRENAEVVRRLLDAIGSRDLECLLELTDPDVKWRSFFALGEGDGEYRGHTGLRQYLGDLAESWDVLRIEVDSLLDAGAVVVAVGHIHYKGRESGAESTAHAGWMFKLRDGRVVVFRAFNDPEQTLEAVGAGGR